MAGGCWIPDAGSTILSALTELKPVMLGHVDDMTGSGEVMLTGEAGLSSRFRNRWLPGSDSYPAPTNGRKA